MNTVEEKIYSNDCTGNEFTLNDLKKTALSPESPAIDLSKPDMILALVMPLCGFLYWNMHIHFMPGLGTTIFTLVICTVSLVYMSKSGFRQNAKSLTCLALIAFSAVQFAIFDNMFLLNWNRLFLTGMFIYWICLSTGRSLDEKLSHYILGDGVKQVLSVPFRNFGCCFCGILKNFSDRRNSKGIFAALAGIAVSLPLLVLVINLLVSADLAFENFMRRLFELNIISFIHIWQFAIGIPVAFYLYGLIYGNVSGRHGDKVTKDSVDKAAGVFKIAPKLAIYSALTAFNLVYLVFFTVQAGYLFSAFAGNLPEGFTYAEYARRGFFELCRVAGINLGVLAAAHLLIKRGTGEEPKSLKGQTLAISLFTILLIVTALSKMVMYMNVYGLTQLRIYTSWFMLVLFFTFILVCVRQFAKINLVKAVIITFVLMFTALSYSNVDGHIARHNIARFESGAADTLDVWTLRKLGSAARPFIYDLYKSTDDEALRVELGVSHSYVWDWDGEREEVVVVEAFPLTEAHIFINSDFRRFNFQRHRADTMLLEIIRACSHSPK